MPSPPKTTTVSISATVDVLGNTISVNTGDINQLRNGNFVFGLSQPVVLGGIDDFVGWLGSSLHLDVNKEDVDNLGQYIPIPALRTLYEQFVEANVTLTTLTINTQAGAYAFGATMTFEALTILPPLLQINSVGVLVSHNSGTGSPSS
jgi:hypothetical protein